MKQKSSTGKSLREEERHRKGRKVKVRNGTPEGERHRGAGKKGGGRARKGLRGVVWLQLFVNVFG